MSLKKLIAKDITSNLFFTINSLQCFKIYADSITIKSTINLIVILFQFRNSFLCVFQIQ